MRPREAYVKYEDGVVKYIDRDTGELLETRPLSSEEQLNLSGTRIDAEQIIRQAREEEK
jgi:hypothetical protein